MSETSTEKIVSILLIVAIVGALGAAGGFIYAETNTAAQDNGSNDSEALADVAIQQNASESTDSTTTESESDSSVRANHSASSSYSHSTDDQPELVITKVTTDADAYAPTEMVTITAHYETSGDVDQATAELIVGNTPETVDSRTIYLGEGGQITFRWQTGDAVRVETFPVKVRIGSAIGQKTITVDPALTPASEYVESYYNGRVDGFEAETRTTVGELENMVDKEKWRNGFEDPEAAYNEGVRTGMEDAESGYPDFDRLNESENG